jgi:hypothetical protein
MIQTLKPADAVLGGYIMIFDEVSSDSKLQLSRIPKPVGPQVLMGTLVISRMAFQRSGQCLKEVNTSISKTLP